MTTRVPTPEASVLERNLRALGAGSARAAGAIRAAPPRHDLVLAVADDGGLTGIADGRRLASAHRPIEEGRRHADSVPLEQAAGVAVLGFGLGHHIGPLASRLKRTGVIFIFEPDVALLRAVLERVDCAPWITQSNVCVLTDPDDAAAIAGAVSGVEGLLALGVKFLSHPPSRARLGGDADRFSARFAEVMRAVRTTILTTLVQVDATFRNELGNLEPYARALGVAELENVHKGKPAVVVAAGPSLHRNIDELSRPGVRERVVVVAVQTVLKTLLARGIRPDYVTSLDYAEVSARFYEGLSASDVEGVELVVEPKAHPKVLRAFPGVIRCPSSRVLDGVLGPKIAQAKGSLRPGATVAHLAYYLARHVGCDPVILIGQDLGFTDGQYYYAGAAIHQVWSGELNDFNTLEMLEWQRIVRSRSMLHRRTDVLGRPVYTDEQMTTYLAQFERDFLADSGAGLTVIDATEGGVAKRHTRVMTLRGALEPLGGVPSGSGAGVTRRAAQERRLQGTATGGAGDDPLRSRIRERAGEVRREVWQVAALSRQTADLLRQMQAAVGDNVRVNALIQKVYGLRDRVEALGVGYDLVQFLNQTGTLNRLRADRALELDDSLPELERQRRQIERDITNVEWLADAADALGSMLDDAGKSLDGRGTPARAARTPVPEGADARAASPARARVWAVVHADARRSGLGAERDLGAPVAGGRTALELTLSRLRLCREIDAVLVIGDDERSLRAMAGGQGRQDAGGVRVEFAGVDMTIARERARSIAGARLVARHAWRGGPGNMSVFDEACCPSLVAPLLERFGIDAAAVVGADWCLIDPVLVDATVSRYRENPAVNQLTFSQAPPGVGTCVVAGKALRELGEAQGRAGAFGTLGALLGYIPIAPQADPIGKPVCVSIAPSLRDVGIRCIPDAPFERAALAPLLDRIAGDPGSVRAENIGAELAGTCEHERAEMVRLELCTQRPGGGQRALWLAHDTGRGSMIPLEQALDAVTRFADASTVLSLEGRGDPLLHPEWRAVLGAACRAGYGAVHVRTDLAGPADDVRALAEVGPALVSVDLLAHSAATYAAITGCDAYDRARANVELLLSLRSERGGLPAQWVVPRLTRCDAVYLELEGFYDHWLMQAGAAAIDPLPVPMPGQRIAPLPPPACVRRRDRARVVTIRCTRGSEELAEAEKESVA